MGRGVPLLHVAVWTECRRVLKPGGIFVLNVKDHIRKGVLQEVTKWHSVALLILASSARAACTCPVPASATAPTGICASSMRASCSSGETADPNRYNPKEEPMYPVTRFA